MYNPPVWLPKGSLNFLNFHRNLKYFLACSKWHCIFFTIIPQSSGSFTKWMLRKFQSSEFEVMVATRALHWDQNMFPYLSILPAKMGPWMSLIVEYQKWPSISGSAKIRSEVATTFFPIFEGVCEVTSRFSTSLFRMRNSRSCRHRRWWCLQATSHLSWGRPYLGAGKGWDGSNLKAPRDKSWSIVVISSIDHLILSGGSYFP